MVHHLNHNARRLKALSKRKRPRRAWGSYLGTITTEERTLAAVGLVETHDWPIRRASALCCTCLTNVYFVQSLGAADRALLAEGRVSISRLRKQHAPLLRRGVTAERAVKVSTAQTPAGTFDAASIGRLVDRIVTQFGPDILMSALDRATAPNSSVTKPNGNGAAAHT